MSPYVEAPPNISPLGACTWKIALKYKVKQSKNRKFTSNYNASPIVLKRKFAPVDKPLRTLAPPKINPSKKAFEKYKPGGLFSEFYGIRFRLRDKRSFCM